MTKAVTYCTIAVCMGICLGLLLSVNASATSTDIESDSNDGYISYEGDGEEYAEVHDAGVGTDLEDSSNFLDIGQTVAGGDYWIGRTYLFFNTSFLTSDDIIANVELWFYLWQDWTTTDFGLTIQRVECDKPLDIANYDYNLFSGDYGSVETSTFSGAGWYSITVDVSFYALIEINGFTYLGLRSDNDIDANEPRNGEYIILNAEESANEPYLKICYINRTEIAQNYSFDSSTWFNATNGSSYANCSVWWDYYWDNDSFVIGGNNSVVAGGNITGSIVDNTSEDWLWISGLDFEGGVLGLVVLSLFFYFAERKEDYALYILTFVIAMGTMYYYFGQGGIYSVEWFTGLALLLFGMYSLYLSIYYGMKNAGGRKV